MPSLQHLAVPGHLHNLSHPDLKYKSKAEGEGEGKEGGETHTQRGKRGVKRKVGEVKGKVE